MRMKHVQVLSGISCQSFFLVFVILIFYFRKRFFACARVHAVFIVKIVIHSLVAIKKQET